MADYSEARFDLTGTGPHSDRTGDRLMTPETKKRWSSRKFWTMNVWLAVFTLLMGLGYVPAEVYSVLAGGTLGAYLCANVAQHVWGKV